MPTFKILNIDRLKIWDKLVHEIFRIHIYFEIKFAHLFIEVTPAIYGYSISGILMLPSSC